MIEAIQPGNTHRLVQCAQSRRGWITQVVWSLNSRALAVSGATGAALYSVEDGRLILRGVLEGHSSHVKGVAVHPGGTLIATASADTTARLWHLAEGGRSDALRGHTASVNSVAFSPDGTLLATAGGDWVVRLWDVATRSQRARFEGHSDEITCVRFTSDGRGLLSGGWDNTLRLWDVGSDMGRVLAQHEDWIREIATSPRPDIIATASKDQTLCLWDLSTGEQKGRILAHLGGADSASFNPDFTLLASGGRDHLIKLWDLKSGKQIGQLSGHEKPVISVAFSPDGRWIASGSGDNTLRIWGVKDAETGYRTHSL